MLFILLFFFPLFFKEGREKGKRITEVVVKSHAFFSSLRTFKAFVTPSEGKFNKAFLVVSNQTVILADLFLCKKKEKVYERNVVFQNLERKNTKLK